MSLKGVRSLSCQLPPVSCLLTVAEGEGFEPPVPLITGQRFSRPPPSTTRPSLLAMISSTYNFNCQGSSTLSWGLWSAEIFQRVTSWNIPYVKGLLLKKAPVFQPIRYSAQTVRLDREFHEDCFKKRRASANIVVAKQTTISRGCPYGYSLPAAAQFLKSFWYKSTGDVMLAALISGAGSCPWESLINVAESPGEVREICTILFGTTCP